MVDTLARPRALLTWSDTSWERNTFPNPTAWSIITIALFPGVRADDSMVCPQL